MLKPVIYPYKMGSQSAKHLAQSLECKRVYPNGTYRPRRNHLIINWGNSTYPNWWGKMYGTTEFLNTPTAVAQAANKLKTFTELYHNGVCIPEFTTSKTEAQLWVEQGIKVFCRTTIISHSGQGIVIATTPDELVDAPLYVKAIKKDKEYRVHVFNGKVIDYQQKKKREGFEGGTSSIRNYANGWIYARSGVELSEEVSSESVGAVLALGLDFGAVDVCTDLDGNVFVFEVNTAPGLQGTTFQKYTEAFKELL